MLLSLFVLLVVLGVAFLVFLLIAISRDKLVTQAVLDFQQFEMPVLDESTAYSTASSGKAKDGLASESKRIGSRKRDLAPSGLVLWTAQIIRSEWQRRQDKF